MQIYVTESCVTERSSGGITLAWERRLAEYFNRAIKPSLQLREITDPVGLFLKYGDGFAYTHTYYDNSPEVRSFNGHSPLVQIGPDEQDIAQLAGELHRLYTYQTNPETPQLHGMTPRIIVYGKPDERRLVDVAVRALKSKGIEYVAGDAASRPFLV